MQALDRVCPFFFFSAFTELARQSPWIDRVWAFTADRWVAPARVREPVICSRQAIPGQQHVHHGLTFARCFCMQGQGCCWLRLPGLWVADCSRAALWGPASVHWPQTRTQKIWGPGAGSCQSRGPSFPSGLHWSLPTAHVLKLPTLPHLFG